MKSCGRQNADSREKLAPPPSVAAELTPDAEVALEVTLDAAVTPRPADMRPSLASGLREKLDMPVLVLLVDVTVGVPRAGEDVVKLDVPRPAPEAPAAVPVPTLDADEVPRPVAGPTPVAVLPVLRGAPGEVGPAPSDVALAPSEPKPRENEPPEPMPAVPRPVVVPKVDVRVRPRERVSVTDGISAPGRVLLVTLAMFWLPVLIPRSGMTSRPRASPSKPPPASNPPPNPPPCWAHAGIASIKAAAAATAP
ncbi:MAG TPA: hypothetical protein VIN61_05415 [Gammaproteobacteria bacterium]